MPLPIAIGGVSLSSERLKEPYEPPPSKSSIGTVQESQVPEHEISKPKPYQSVTWAVCPRNEWQARTVVSFFDKEEKESSNNDVTSTQHEPQTKYKRKRMLEIRLQISPLTRALSPKVYRETSYHLPLFTYQDDEGEEEDEIQGDHKSESSSLLEDQYEESYYTDSESDDDDHPGDAWRPQHTHRQHQVIFSEDRRHLVVLLFHSKRSDPNKWQQQQQSAIIVFQLRKPRNRTTSSADIRSKIPLPSYIASKATPASNDDEGKESPIQSTPSNSMGRSPLVATQPKFVPSCNGVTAICPLSRELSNANGGRRQSVPQPTYFLAMKNDGTLNWVNTVSAQIVASATLSMNHCFVSSMKASPCSKFDGGMLALVMASSNPSFPESDSSQSVTSYVTDDDDDDDNIEEDANGKDTNKLVGEHFEGGDCVLIKWSISSEGFSSNGNKTMNVKLSSVWSPPSGSGKNDELRVTGVCFGSLPSVLCVVYTHSNTGQVTFGPRQKLAQILTISHNQSNCCNPACELLPTVSLYLSPEQIEQAPTVGNLEEKTNYHGGEADENFESDDENYSMNDGESYEFGRLNFFGATRESRLVDIQHDPSSDSFVISSIFCGNRGKNDHWVGYVWNWRANAIGWMIQHEIATLTCSSRIETAGSDIGSSWSRLYCGRETCGKGYLVFINSMMMHGSTNNFGDPINSNNSTVLKTSKRFVPVGMLSPTNSVNPTVFTERSSLLLAENHVSFPSVISKDSDLTVREIDWKISALPLSYTTLYGPPRIAAMGATRAKSIAVSSTRGVCVVDTKHKKWKQFGSPSEERSFSIIAMTWWEGFVKGQKEDEREDLLVAVTQTESGGQYLSCWSSKR